MKLLVLIILFLYVQNYSVQAISPREELIATAKLVAQREARARADQELNTRAQREAERLGVSGDSSRVHAIRLILVHFGKDARTAIAVSRAESGLRCNASGDGGSSIGLYQINHVHWYKWPRETLFDCETNVRAAYQIFKSSGWYPWSVFKNKMYLSYM